LLRSLQEIQPDFVKEAKAKERRKEEDQVKEHEMGGAYRSLALWS
jgi:hypothetical protein